MATIKPTVIGTSDPIDLCKGFYLFDGGSKRVQQLGYRTSRSLLETNPELLAWRFEMDAGFTFFAGVCGPGYAIRFEAEGETSGDEIQLNVSNDEIAAGF